jgi:hypothetical protein
MIYIYNLFLIDELYIHNLYSTLQYYIFCPSLCSCTLGRYSYRVNSALVRINEDIFRSDLYYQLD